MGIFDTLILIIISFIPILIWGYLFSYLDDSKLNRFRFFIGILAGVISIFPVLYLGDVIEKLNFNYLNIFSNIYGLSNFSDLFGVFLSFFSVFLLISIIPFISFFSFSKDKMKIFFYNTFIFGIYMIFISLLFYLLQLVFDNFGVFSNGNYNLKFGDIAFNSLKLVIFYYLIIAILEELSKFFCFNYSSYFKIEDYRQGVLYAIFVALGFSFLENILYFYNLYINSSSGIVGVYFSRNLFSVILHVLCSSIFAYFFSIAYIRFRYVLKYNFIKLIFIGFILSVFVHALFNIFLTLNLTFMVFFYFIGAYFYLGYLFYKD